LLSLVITAMTARESLFTRFHAVDRREHSTFSVLRSHSAMCFMSASAAKTVGGFSFKEIERVNGGLHGQCITDTEDHCDQDEEADHEVKNHFILLSSQSSRGWTTGK
jgi:hypothetical protein